MPTQHFDKQEAIQFGWDVMKAHFGFFVGLLLLFYGLTMVPEWIVDWAREQSKGLTVILKFLSWLFSMFLGAGLLRVVIRLARQRKVAIRDLFSAGPVYANYLIGNVCYGLCVFMGCLLLIVPGIIWAIKYAFVPFLLVDQGCGLQEAFRVSARMTEGTKKELFVFGLILGAINLAGALCLGIGLLVTIPTTMVANAYVYQRLYHALSEA